MDSVIGDMQVYVCDVEAPQGVIGEAKMTLKMGIKVIAREAQTEAMQALVGDLPIHTAKVDKKEKGFAMDDKGKVGSPLTAAIMMTRWGDGNFNKVDLLDDYKSIFW